MIAYDQDFAWLFTLSAKHAATEGMSVEVMLAETLLMGISISGGRLTWKRSPKAVPQIAKSSVTWLGMPNEHPLWFHRYCEPVIEQDQMACKVLADLIGAKVSATEVRKRKRHQKVLGKWIPHAFETCDSESLSFLRHRPGFLVKVGWKATKQHLASAVFGQDRMLLLTGKSDYHGLAGSSASAAQLRSAAANFGGGLRVTVHGWCEEKSFQRLCRKSPDLDSRIFGWVLPAKRLYTPPDHHWTKAKLIGGMFGESFRLRYIAPVSHYCPEPEIAEILTHTDDSWVVPAWCDFPFLRGQMRSEESLAWQLAAQLHNIHRKEELAAETGLWIAEVAATLSKWIRGCHARELRLLYPGPDGDPSDPLSCGIADQLLVDPKSIRDLVRGFHKVGSEEVRGQLERMRSEGWVEELENGRWKLAFPVLPDLSAKLSEIVPSVW